MCATKKTKKQTNKNNCCYNAFVKFSLGTRLLPEGGWGRAGERVETQSAGESDELAAMENVLLLTFRD